MHISVRPRAPSLYNPSNLNLYMYSQKCSQLKNYDYQHTFLLSCRLSATSVSTPHAFVNCRSRHLLFWFDYIVEQGLKFLHSVTSIQSQLEEILMLLRELSKNSDMRADSAVTHTPQHPLLKLLANLLKPFKIAPSGPSTRGSNDSLRWLTAEAQSPPSQK